MMEEFSIMASTATYVEADECYVNNHRINLMHGGRVDAFTTLDGTAAGINVTVDGRTVFIGAHQLINLARKVWGES
jgi:hypothetical protein